MKVNLLVLSGLKSIADVWHWGAAAWLQNLLSEELPWLWNPLVHGGLKAEAEWRSIYSCHRGLDGTRLKELKIPYKFAAAGDAEIPKSSIKPDMPLRSAALCKPTRLVPPSRPCGHLRRRALKLYTGGGEGLEEVDGHGDIDAATRFVEDR
ncbi:hypothetical protein EJ110_NYTH25328 [Nymphaea thermarum]|nr:hypothetical protein EJ110_NYTH25328 [Nymphaea thermarum]